MGQWLMENYDLAALPVGAALMLFGGQVGTVLGALALGGGAYGLWDRYRTLNDVGAPIEIPEEHRGNPQAAATFRQREVLRRLTALREAASKGQDSDEWKQWFSDPHNRRFHESFSLLDRFAPDLTRDAFRSRVFPQNAGDTRNMATRHVVRRATGADVTTDEGWDQALRNFGFRQQQQ